jgi:1-deoxy-D-xylulose-5-phosphate reductoisomerase
LLTASGGPFFGWSSEQLDTVTPQMALAHPTWKMGPKITIDCATLMNKGFELIEACRLFGVDSDRVEVLEPENVRSAVIEKINALNTKYIEQEDNDVQ